ncbi:DUF4245 domain-containing protein [Micromonospora sp. WMMA1363]|uniref:DUF4245 domain-containing protein n=1 Tax=Micromonospora sp. WMMA1363 TaxID=3053985 RepID=UPI00259CD892|nr:DUF4245 domain-containing protein [Micromonospora sp. WMMA1363]MDM4722494.1 DUF4245 domain-containing protein [Micromonospora sp. WMMA1363]
MEPAQPADREPAHRTPPEGQPPVDPVPAGADPAAPVPPGEPALVESADSAARTPGEGGGAVETGEHPAPPPAADAGRSERSPKDMAISLLVLLVPIALLLAFYRGFLGGDQPAVVDPAPALDSARAANAFPVTQPEGLGDGWRVVNAGFRTTEGGATLRLGYLTPEGRGAQVVQSDVPAERLLPAELTDEGQPQGQTDLGGRTWQLYTARGNEQALVLLEPDRTVIVVGDARDNELRTLAGSLR